MFLASPGNVVQAIDAASGDLIWEYRYEFPPEAVKPVAATRGLALYQDKEHLDWHRQHNDTWTWNTYMIVSGERLGQYITMSPDHAWADFDAPAVSEREDAADATSKLGPHIESLSSGFWNELRDLSRPPDASPPYPLIQIIDYGIKFGKRAVFERNVVQFGQTVDATNVPATYFVVREARRWRCIAHVHSHRAACELGVDGAQAWSARLI